MQDLTLEQLENQIQTINNTRFLLERTHNGSESTINELDKILKELRDEKHSRS